MNIKRRVRISLFINGFGSDVVMFDSLPGAAERAKFLIEKFGKNGIGILQAREMAKMDALPLGWFSRVGNFFIRLVDWKA